MTDIYVPSSPEAMPLLPAIGKEVYDLLHDANSLDRNLAYERIRYLISEQGGVPAIHIGMDCAEAEMIRQGASNYRDPSTPIQRQVCFAYAALLHQDEYNQREHKRQGFPAVSQLPELPTERNSPESDQLTDITDAYCGSPTLVEKTREQLRHQENDYMNLIVDGALDHPNNEMERNAAQIGCIGMWGALNSYAHYLLTR